MCIRDRNIVIEDKLETQGASIVKDSIFVKKNGIELKDAKIEADDTGFVSQTGASLSDMDLSLIHIFHCITQQIPGKISDLDAEKL